MITVLEKSRCVGCGACENICSRQCITLKTDTEGFAYPSVNQALCIDCKLCEKVCPVLHKQTINSEKICFAAKCKDEGIRESSSSGGIFTVMAHKVHKQGGLVFGAAFDKDWNVYHTVADTAEKLKTFQGAKYIQSQIGLSYQKTKSALQSGRPVLFSGTPCQIAGLRTFLGKEYKNLYTIELICHGVPSYKVFQEFIKEQIGERHMSAFSFRDKSTGWTTYNMVLKTDEGHIQRFLHGKNIFMYGFISNLYLRPSCYACPFKDNRSGADITLGDFWGIDKIRPEFQDEKGVSAVILNSSKGKDLYRQIQTDIVDEQASFEDIVKNNLSLLKSSTPNPWRKFFFEKLGKKSFTSLVRMMDSPSLWLRIRLKLENLITKNG